MATPAFEPARAPVRPRITRDGAAVPRLLEEEVAALLTAGTPAVVELVGPHGAGKTTALAHLAAVFGGERRLELRDVREDTGELRPDAGMVVRARLAAAPHGATCFFLAPWTDDDALEYLLAAHPGRVAEAFATWRAAAERRDLWPWPGLCRRVLDVLATTAGGAELVPALRAALEEYLGPRLAAALDWALRQFVRPNPTADPTPCDVPAIAGDPVLWSCRLARAVLAAARVLDLVADPEPRPSLRLLWRPELVLAVARLLAGGDPALLDRLHAMARTTCPQPSLVLSLLCAAGPGYRPPRPLPSAMASTYLAACDLRGVAIRADLAHADLTARPPTGRARALPGIIGVAAPRSARRRRWPRAVRAAPPRRPPRRAERAARPRQVDAR